MVIISAQGQFTFILESELGSTLRKCVTGPHFRGANVMVRERLGIATVAVLQKSNDQRMVTLVGNVRYQSLTRQG